jgi:hypothetical protein
MEYTHIQMIFHAKALEMLTIAYQELQEINTESDLEEFRNTFTSNSLRQFQQQQQQSKQSGINSPQKNSYENLFNDRLNRTSNSTANNNQDSLGQRRSKSNENLKKPNSAATASTSSINNSQTNRPVNNTSSHNKNFHSSAPHLNQDGQHHLSSRDRSFNRSQMDIEDLTDDSDAE